MILTDFIWRSNSKEKQIFMNKVKDEESNYFSRLSNLDIKRWLAEEYYRRSQFNLKSMTDETF